MIEDLSSATPDALPVFDVCIVGTGPAGTTLARELSGAGLAIGVLECGRRKPTRWHDALRPVTSDGIRIKDYSRERVLGGASTTWAGLSSPLDPIDFAERAWVPSGGWPFPREELLPYWKAAAARYRFAPPRLFEPGGFDALKAQGDVALAWDVLEEKVFLAAAKPQDFGQEFAALWEGEEVRLLLDATVVRLGREQGATDAADGLPRVTFADVRSSTGRALRVRAKAFVLATGGIENARLLLQSTDVCAAGLGNERDQVGRWLMNHPKSYHGTIRLARPVRDLAYHFGCIAQGYAGYAGLRLREDEQARRRVLNSYVRFEPVFPWTDDPGVESLVLLVKKSRVLLDAVRRRGETKVVTLRDYSETGDDSDLQNARKSWFDWIKVVATVALHVVPVTRYVLARLRATAPLVKSVRVRNFMEMEPVAENRVTLGDGRDALGMPVPRVRHDTSALDRRSLVELHRALADELSRNGFGELQSDLERADPWPVDLDASHHLGTTRMGTDPATSVCDAQGRLHAVGNVWCAGASVFPTSGCANPTLTIVALAVRLARHLREDVFGLAPSVAVAGPEADAPPARWTLAAGAPAAGKRRVHVVGAGGRVTSDVLPALASLSGRVVLAGLWATSARSVVAGGQRYEARPLAELDDDALREGDLVHVAVSKAAVPKVVRRIAAVRASGVELLLDTPVLLFKHLGHLRALDGFARVEVAEDCTTLPWLDTVRAAGDVLGPLREVRFARGAFRYHAFALMKTLLGCERVTRARRRRVGAGAEVTLRFANGARASMSEPRDYATGRLELAGERATASDRPAEVPGALPLELLVDGDRARGFRLGDVETALRPGESELLGPVRAGDVATQHTDRLKTVGLRRLYEALLDGGHAWPLAEGLDDMALDFWLDRLGRWRSNPLVTLRSEGGRRRLARVMRALAGG